MAYTQEMYRAAMDELARRRNAAEAEAKAFRQRMIDRYPQLIGIERGVAGAASQIARAILSGGDVDQTVEAIRQNNLALQEEMAAILASAGEDRRDFEPRYTCPLCDDTGYADGHICSCLQTLLREEASRQLSRMASMELTSFEDMTLDVYPTEIDPRLGQSPRDRMAGTLQYCRDYAADFSTRSPSLLVTGGTGVGKTHAVLAIAHEAAKKGFSVVYGPAGTLLGRLEKEHFGRIEGDSESTFLDCDLLVLDDLGTEFVGPFYAACLYNLVNSRLLSGRPTIISTNLGRSDLLERYGEQTASRILGAYQPLPFFGRDIRQIKAVRRQGWE